MHIHKTLTFKIIYKCIIVWIYMRSEKKKIEPNGCIERIFTVTDTGDVNGRKPE